MELGDWIRIAEELKESQKGRGPLPDIILWGGEPLLCPYFDPLAQNLRRMGFRLGIVTNGVLMDRHAELLRQEFEHIYVSLDGDRQEHDKVRGDGVFDRVARNLGLVHGGNAKVSLMTVISRDNLEHLEELPDALCGLDCDEILLQEMIFLSKEEVSAYKRWMEECFGTVATEIDSWVNEPVEEEKKRAALEKIGKRKYPKNVAYLPHGKEGTFCRSPFSHIHVAWNGNVMYCTDFYDFSAGNVKEDSLISIFHNSKSEKFREEIRKGNCVACDHCSWINSRSFRLDA